MGARNSRHSGSDVNANHRNATAEPNARLIMAVVAIGVIIGAIASPGKQEDQATAHASVVVQP